MEKVSVTVCTYNRGNIIGECIESILKNNIEKDLFEVLIIDNNSTDNTKEVVEQFCLKYSNVRYIREEKVGLSYARNRGIKEANGTIIAFIDDDVKVNENYIKYIIDFFNENSTEVCISGKVIPVWDFEKPEWFVSDFASIIGETTYGETVCTLKFREYPIGCNMIFKKNIFNKVGLFNTELGIQGDKLYLGEEVDICDRILKLGKKIYYLPNAFVYHKVHQNKVDQTYILNRLKLEGESVAHWHYETKSRISRWVQFILRAGILCLRDYPALLFSKISNKHVFWRRCKVARTKSYLKKSGQLFLKRGSI
ncbi:hypothetical protein COC60_06190 [Bacillus thuringiensis]|uniref:glycosyltransferase family 2 protein n=1 Tax=Bacillus thuringiensis TaxID=1428 RepID=UPI000BEC5DCB|nr:glycosyltransferase [Bacillus thuringiensis]MEB9403805.1 glycosyltransferase [Bacillus cereus]MCC6081345.1 glycosyltransferase [Bacillus thuringiensis]MEB9554719.1 glycosyltransferase [Bacillus cereus]PEB88263.1 hypothetical protein COM94_04720 [Bacillus thuringiensis]PFJ61691.1 hypothetical protein COJ02_00160 [Bacillus thuringiensis]